MVGRGPAAAARAAREVQRGTDDLVWFTGATHGDPWGRVLGEGLEVVAVVLGRFDQQLGVVDGAFEPAAQPHPVGHLLRNPALAATLRLRRKSKRP